MPTATIPNSVGVLDARHPHFGRRGPRAVGRACPSGWWPCTRSVDMERRRHGIKAKVSTPNGLMVEARVRVTAPVGNGLVAALFLYMDKRAPLPGNPDALASDKIYLELLTNQIYRSNDPDNFEHAVVLAIYNDFQGQWDMIPYNWNGNVLVRKLNLTEWNAFRIYWRPGVVDWYWDPDAAGEPDRLLASSVRVLPDEPMSLYFSFWAATDIWRTAWDPNLHPTSDPNARDGLPQADPECRFSIL